MMISKIQLKCFQINLMLDLFMCVKFIINFLKLLIRGNILFFQISNLIFLASFLLFTFFFEFAKKNSIFFPTRIAKLRKFETKKTCWLGGRGVVNPII